MNTPRPYSDKRGFVAAIAVAVPAMLIGSGLSPPRAGRLYRDAGATGEQRRRDWERNTRSDRPDSY